MKNFVTPWIFLLGLFIGVLTIDRAAGQDAEIQKPYGGEYLITGTQATIAWEPVGDNTQTIAFSQDNGATWETTASGLAAADSVYTWTVPQISSNECRLRITEETANGDTLLSAPFSIGNAADIPKTALDENFNDWQHVAGYTNEASSSIETLKAFNDSEFLYIMLERNEVFSLQNDDNTVLYLDTDCNANTGKQVNGIGAEIEFSFGTREGTAYFDDNTYEIGASALFLVSSPTVISDRFEISIDRTASISGHEVFSGNRIRVLLKDKQSGNFAPLQSGGMGYRFRSYENQLLSPYQVKKPQDTLLRMLSSNVEFDGFFEEAHKPSFARMFQAAAPDIIGLQEIYEHSNAEVEARLEEMLPSPEGSSWNAAHIQDNFLATRYQIIGAYAPGGFGNGAFLVDLRPDFDTEMLIFVAHPPCCDNDAERQKEVDAMAAFLREAKSGEGEIELDPRTPIVMLGDMNFVGDTLQQETLLQGNIQDEATYGSDFSPDWDQTGLEDAKPFVTHLPMTFTQGNSEGPGRYSKGRLDYVMYSGAVMHLHNSYVMYTHSMPADTLEAYKLQQEDTETASDHFPLVADFSLEAMPEEGHSILPIRQNDASGKPALLKQIRTISGTVTAADAFGTYGPAFIQDQEAGVALYGKDLVAGLHQGDSVTITAKVGFFNGLTEMMYDVKEASATATSGTLPQPDTVTISRIKNQAWDDTELLEGRIIHLENITIDATGNLADDTTYPITDGTNTLSLRIDGNTNIEGLPLPEGNTAITGVLSQFDNTSPFSSGYQLMPRNISDFDSTNIPQASFKAPDAQASFQAGETITIAWNSAHVDSLNLAYSLKSQTSWQPIVSGVAATTGSYDWQAPQLTDSVELRLSSYATTSVLDTSSAIYIQDQTGLSQVDDPNLHLISTPNPCKSNPRIRFSLPTPSQAHLTLRSFANQQLFKILKQNLPAGEHQLTLQRSLKPGVYLCRLTTSYGSATQKIVVL